MIENDAGNKKKHENTFFSDTFKKKISKLKILCEHASKIIEM